MIKTSIMFSAHTLHVLHVVLRDTLIVLIVLFLALFSWLKYGIQADKFTVGKFAVEGLYIKLDKKLTFHAEKLVIPKSKEKPSFDRIDETFDKIKDILTYFESIELNEIDFNDNVFHFIFADDVLYISSDDYEVAGNIERKGSRLIADVSLLYLKKSRVTISGKLKYFLNKDRLETEGHFDGFGIEGNFAAFKDNEDVSFALNSQTFYDLKALTAALPLKEKIKSWIADKVVAKSYKLNSFVGKAHIIDNALKVDMASLRGDALLKEVQIHYKEELAPVLAEEIKLVFQNSGLYFSLEKPRYKGRKLDGSRVSIVNFGQKNKVKLQLDLHVRSQMDAVVQKILKAYHITIPVVQNGSNITADVNLTIPLIHRVKGVPVKKEHRVKVLVNADLPKGKVTINDRIKLNVLGGKVHFHNGVADLKQIVIKERAYAGKINGKVYTKKKKVDLDLDIDYLKLGNQKEEFFHLEKKKVGVVIDYGKTLVSIPAYDILLKREGKHFTITLSDLKKIKPYLKNIEFKMDGGHLTIQTNDFETFSFKGLLKRNACFFYDKNDVCHTQVPCRGEISKSHFLLEAFDDRLKVDINKGLITVKNLNIDLKAFFEARQKSSKNVKKSSGKSRILTILGTKSKLRYSEYTLVTDNYKIVVSPNGNIDATGKLKDDKVKLIKKGKNITVEAIRIRDQLLHPLINFNGLKNGRYTFKSYGDPDKIMHGEIIIEGGVMKDFKAYNNTLAFINTLPALATLHSPGFSKKGFTIKKGIAKYRKIGQKIFFEKIYIEGTSANFVGEGEIDLARNTININLAIQTARELGKVVGAVPVFGYILMGEDKSMTVGLKISGSLSKPIVKTSATKEILKLPLDLIKRTLEAPGQLIKKKPKKKTEPVIKKREPEPFNVVAP